MRQTIVSICRKKCSNPILSQMSGILAAYWNILTCMTSIYTLVTVLLFFEDIKPELQTECLNKS